MTILCVAAGYALLQKCNEVKQTEEKGAHDEEKVGAAKIQ